MKDEQYQQYGEVLTIFQRFNNLCMQVRYIISPKLVNGDATFYSMASLLKKILNLDHFGSILGT